MNYKKYIAAGVLLMGVIVMACRDESLYPLPYDDRTSGAYLRIIKITSNVWDFNNLANSGFEGVYESVDENDGADLETIEFYVTHRSGATGFITDEVFVKSVDASSFVPVPEPTYSVYLRSAPIRVTAAETIAALTTLATDPDGTTCTGIFPDVCTMVAFPVGGVAVGDQIIYRWKTILKDGRTFTVSNPQSTVTPAFGNPNEANMTPNVTGGQFYNAPFFYTQLVRNQTTTLNPAAYTGNYRMDQVAIWSPNHSVDLHNRAFPTNLNEFLFGTSATDSTQTVTLTTVSGGLSTERELSCLYRGQTITMRINLEERVLGLTTAGLSGASLTTLTGLGFTGATNTNLGTVFVPLVNSTVQCTSERELFLVTPLGGSFGGVPTLPWGLPRSTFPNRGYYRLDQDGLTLGQVFSIAVDDDVDEYGRRNGYCSWYRRVYLRMTKI